MDGALSLVVGLARRAQHGCSTATSLWDLPGSAIRFVR